MGGKIVMPSLTTSLRILQKPGGREIRKSYVCSQGVFSVSRTLAIHRSNDVVISVQVKNVIEALLK